MSIGRQIIAHLENFTHRTLILLGFGDLAQRLAKLSEARGKPVFALRRTSVTSSTKTIVGDATNTETLRSLFDGESCDIVVTLTPDEYSEIGYRKSYLACAEALSKTSPEISPDSRLIFVSSTSVYGQNHGEVITEDSETRPRSDTAKVLLEAEEVVASLDLATCNLRFSGIYGPGRTRLISSVRDGNIAPPKSVHWTNRIHADDCAGILDFLLELPGSTFPGCLIGTDNQSVPKYDVQRYIMTLLGGENSPSLINETSTEPSASEAEQTGKRCSNILLKKLGYEYCYPTYKEGFSDLIKSEHQGR